MFDEKDQTTAKAQGWRLVVTVESGSRHAFLDVVRHTTKFATDAEALKAVVDAARRGSTYHQQALKLVIDSRARKKRK